MIWTIILSSLFVIAMVLFIIFHEEITGVFLCLTTILFLLFVCFGHAASHLGVEDAINDKLQERQEIIFEINNIDNADFDLALNIMQKATDFNKDIIEDIERNNNPWLNWYVDDRYIEAVEDKLIVIPNIDIKLAK